MHDPYHHLLDRRSLIRLHLTAGNRGRGKPQHGDQSHQTRSSGQRHHQAERETTEPAPGVRDTEDREGSGSTDGSGDHAPLSTARPAF